VVPALVSVLDHKEGGLRYDAARALGQMGAEAKAAIPALARLQADKDEAVRREATKALCHIGKAALPALTASLQSDSVEVRRNVVVALSNLGPDALPALRSAAKDKDEVVRTLAQMFINDLEK
jgi:HEAT repeat protein